MWLCVGGCDSFKYSTYAHTHTHTIGHDWTNQMSSLAGGLMRIHRLMVSLLPYYCSHATWKQLVGMVTAEENKDSVSSEEVFIVAQKVCCNVVDYARAAMTTGGGVCRSLVHILFSLHCVRSLFSFFVFFVCLLGYQFRSRPFSHHFLCLAHS